LSCCHVVILSYYHIVDLLPEGYKPAPRITEADKNNIIQTLDRKLTQRVYLALRPNNDIGWILPTIDLNLKNDNETFVQCVKNYLSSNTMYQNLDIAYLSNCPMAVEAIRYSGNDDKRSENGKYYGEKIFYMRVQYQDGNVGEIDKKALDDWGWLERSEMVERVKAEKGEDASLFYHYML
jgi:large subunit ribosomal protein L46